MRLEDTSENFRTFFLLKFTKEILKNSLGKEMFELGDLIKQINTKNRKEFHQDKFKKEFSNQNLILPKNIFIKEDKSNENFINKPRRNLSEIDLKQYTRSKNIKFKETNIQEEKPFGKFKGEGKKTRESFEKKPIPPKMNVKPLAIPPVKLPFHLQNIKPIPSQLKIDLGKLNPFIDDLMVRAIECNGPDTPLFVLGRMGRKKTNILLTKDEIELILDDFSDFAKIPISEGVYRVAVGNLLLSAIISQVSEPRFVLSKITPMQNF